MALKILLADDSMTAQNMGKKILADAGYEVVAVSNGAQAVKKIAEHKPGLAILDVYMPGYSGLEVCERVKKAAETAGMPVILTYGKMEPFNPEDGNKVGCDGLIVKPFEASDLLAAVKKIEARMSAAAAPPAAEQYEETIKISMPVVEEFKDASYEEWKVTAEDHMDEQTGEAPASAMSLEVPQEMASAPAFGMEEMGEAPLAVVPPDMAETAAVEMPVRDTVAAEPEIRRTTEQIEPALQAAAAAAAAAAPAAFEEFTADAVAPAFEPTIAPPEPEAAPGFEPTVMQEEVAVQDSGRDPALVTDNEELAKFTTKFGVEGAEPITVGVAAEMPELYADAQAPAAPEAPPEKLAADLDFEARVAAAMSGYEEFGAPAAAPAPEPEPAPEPVAEAAPVEEMAAPTPAPEVHPELVEEMQRAVEFMPVAEPEPAVVQEPEPVPIAAPAAAVPENAPDHELAKAMAAAVGASVEPQIVAAVGDSTQALRPDLIAEIVHRVVDRMKPELVSEITKELESQLKK